MDEWEDAPIEDAAATAHAAIAYLTVASTLPTSLQPDYPQPRQLTHGLMGLLKLRRAQRHYDLLRVQGLLLPLLAPLCRLRPFSEIQPLVREATRPAGTQQTSLASIQPGVKLPPAGMLLASSLTATALLVCCAPARRGVLLELIQTPQVILGMDPKMHALCRAVCV